MFLVDVPYCVPCLEYFFPWNLAGTDPAGTGLGSDGPSRADAARIDQAGRTEQGHRCPN